MHFSAFRFIRVRSSTSLFLVLLVDLLPVALEILLSRGRGLKFVLPYQRLGGEACYRNIHHALYFSKSNLDTAL